MRSLVENKSDFAEGKSSVFVGPVLFSTLIGCALD
ncbi:hypothetical protein OROMI_000349 [Orobanche minor]